MTSAGNIRIISGDSTFFFFWLYWVFVAARRLSLVAASRGYSSLRCVSFSLWWLLLLRSTGSRCMGLSSCAPWALERRLSSCGAQAWLLRDMWDFPGPGLEPVSPALAGGFLTTASPGKPDSTFLSRCACTRMIEKVLKGLIWGLQIHFSNMDFQRYEICK